jgi:hypothetical protein
MTLSAVGSIQGRTTFSVKSVVHHHKTFLRTSNIVTLDSALHNQMPVNVDNHALFSLLLVPLPPFIAGGSIAVIRTHLKNVFWSNIFVGAAFQILDIQQYASGLRPTKLIGLDGKSRSAGKLGPAAILNQNPTFEMGSS